VRGSPQLFQTTLSTVGYYSKLVIHYRHIVDFEILLLSAYIALKTIFCRMTHIPLACIVRCMLCPMVCTGVRLSVTRQYCIKTAGRIDVGLDT